MNIAYKHNKDGSINMPFEIKKIYLMVVIPLFALYYFKLNEVFNNDLNIFLDSMGLNIYFMPFLFIVVGIIIFKIADNLKKK